MNDEKENNGTTPKKPDDKKNDFHNERDYAKWTPLKIKTHNRGKIKTFSEGWVWWCIFGENVGTEINGKGDYFLRPVLIFKKTGKLGFIGIPLTTQAREGYGYVKFMFKDKEVYAILSQIKTFSVFRLLRKKGQIDDSDMLLIREQFKEYFGIK